jgi:putative lipoprotein
MAHAAGSRAMTVGLLTVILAGLAVGCRSADPAPRPSADPVAATAPLAAYVFDCDSGPSFILARIEGGTEAIDLVLPDRRYRLPRVVAASGVHYAAGAVSVWNKGREATLEIDGRVSRCVENRPRSIAADARARGVELRATGNEPGWTFELLADRLVFVEAYGARRVTTPRPARQSGLPSDGDVYVAVTESHRLTVRIRPVACVDTMSGERHGSTVEVELDGTPYRGCGDVLAH